MTEEQKLTEETKEVIEQEDEKGVWKPKFDFSGPGTVPAKETNPFYDPKKKVQQELPPHLRR